MGSVTQDDGGYSQMTPISSDDPGSIDRGRPLDASEEVAAYVSNRMTKTATGRKAKLATDTLKHGGADICQFSASIYYALEGREKEIAIDVMRIGSYKGRCSLAYRTTNDGTAESGIHFVALQGRLYFEDGESLKTIYVEIIDDDVSYDIAEFPVELLEPEGCALGRVNKIARVLIADDDYFPNNRYAKEVRTGAEVPGTGLMLQFLYITLTSKLIRWKALAIMLIDQLHNCHSLLITYIHMYLVDVVFADIGTRGEGEVERRMSGVASVKEGQTSLSFLFYPATHSDAVSLIVMLYLGSFALQYVLDYWKTNLNTVGIARKTIQKQFFRRYLHFSEDFRKDVTAAKMSLLLTDEVNDVVDHGLLKSLCVFRMVGKILLVGYFVWKECHRALLPVVCFPVFMVFTILWRMRGFIRIQEDKVESEMGLSQAVHETCRCFHLYADYYQRNKAMHKFMVEVLHHDSANLNLAVAILNSAYFAPLFNTFLSSAFIYVFAAEVIDGSISMGLFFAVLKIFAELGSEFKELYIEAMGVAAAIGPLAAVAHHMNGPMDLKDRHKNNSDTRIAMQEHRHDHGNVNVDRICISIDVTFQYPTSNWALHASEFDVPQGSLVAVCGGHNSGKATLIKLLANNVSSEHTRIFIPSHLRVLQVTQDSLYLEESIWNNLTFGRLAQSQGGGSSSSAVVAPVSCDGAAGTDQYTEERVLNVVKSFGRDSIIQRLQAELRKEVADGDDRWWSNMSTSELAVIHLARAFIADPNVMMLHRPFARFNDVDRITVFGVLKEYVKERGVAVTSQFSLRRPRTCFYTSDTNYDVDSGWKWQKEIDRIWIIAQREDCEASLGPASPFTKSTRLYEVQELPRHAAPDQPNSGGAPLKSSSPESVNLISL